MSFLILKNSLGVYLSKTVHVIIAGHIKHKVRAQEDIGCCLLRPNNLLTPFRILALNILDKYQPNFYKNMFHFQ